ncbi:MAG: putative sugar nucleotidyl transferase [Ferruginibacter sp.]
MKIYLDDSLYSPFLYPFTSTRHVSDIRVGILTIAEKWQQLTNAVIEKYTGSQHSQDGWVIPAHLIPTLQNFRSILKVAAENGDFDLIPNLMSITLPWHIFQLNAAAIEADIDIMTAGRISAPIPEGTRAIAPERIFIEPGATILMCCLNATEGRIYIGKNTLIMEGSLIRGPFAACEAAVVKMGATIYGGTTIGPYSVVGGEIKNSILFAYSNKAHEGYLGDSVIGEWCNLGAGTSNSNVKNTGAQVKYITAPDRVPEIAGQRAGLLMGDYSRCAINTSFNTGTIIGVCCNIFGEIPAKYVNHFSWGKEQYIFEKALQDIDNWKKMKGHELTSTERIMLNNIYLSTQSK